MFQPLDPGEVFVLENDTWLAVAARFKVMLARSPGLSFRLSDRERTLEHLQAQVEPGRLQLGKEIRSPYGSARVRPDPVCTLVGAVILVGQSR